MEPGARAFAPPSAFGEYELVRPLGRGGMGVVYLAHDTLLDRHVAIKFITGTVRGTLDDWDHARFFVEARAIARLAHPNVVAVHRAGVVADHPYLVSELVRGQSLAELPRPMPWREVCAIGIDLARGLAAAHRAGVLHRDLKPANAMRGEDGTVKLLDFGLAKVVEASTARTLKAVPKASDISADPNATRPLAPAPAAGGAGPTSSDAPTERAGTPLYMAPEVWLGQVATERSDLYSLGVLLYELAAGAAPLAGLSAEAIEARVASADAPPLATRAPGVEPRFAALVDALLARDPAVRPASADAVREALEALVDAGAARALPEGAPYRGLAPFEAAHRALFFGRDAEVRAVLDRLRAQPLVLVVADSGIGKSSLCRAGVVPRVEEGALGDVAPRRAISLVPSRRPLVSLAAALGPSLGGEAAVEALLRERPADLGRELRRGEGLVLFVDQLEELVTLAAPAEAAAFAAALTSMVAAGGALRVLATARTDFLSRLQTLPTLGREISAAVLLLGPMDAEGLRQAIVGPVTAKGFRFESEGTVESLLAEALRARGGLPLLEFALALLWDRRDEARRVIPDGALEALGGVSGALARHADGVLAALPPAERAEAMRLLGALLTAEGTRARRADRELVLAGGGPARAALDALVRGRLLVATEADAPTETAYEIAHEALVDGWSTLRGLVSQDAGRRWAEERVARAAREWERLHHAREALWGERQLAETRAAGPGLGELERAFLARSRRAVLGRRLLRGGAVLAVPVLIGAALLVARARVRQELEARIGGHVTACLGALDGAAMLARSVDAERTRALALFDAQRPEEAEAGWTRAAALAHDLEARQLRAQREIEAALPYDPDRPALRALAARALHERWRTSRDPLARDDLAERIVALDPHGREAGSLRAKATLSVTSLPAGAAVSMRRLGGAEVPLAPIGRTPLELALDHGSYLLEVTAEGGPPVRLPILLERGERLAAEVPIPTATEIPAGFVYVPPGRFVLGSVDDGPLRRSFFRAPPAHTATTGGYFIARHEVTFGDWITFLEQLPAAERTRRTPRARISANVALELLPRGRTWELQMRPAGHTYTARAGEPIRYRGRDRRAEQDWLRMPVSAVSYDDALAFSAWLDRTGRVPGARVCTEREWERAARGADARPLPTGDHLGPDDANIDVTYGQKPEAFGPDEVGAHPGSRSLFGVDDLAGNVWEIVAPAAPGLGPTDRGGSFYEDELTALVVNRNPSEPGKRYPLLGLRVCATPGNARLAQGGYSTGRPGQAGVPSSPERF